MNVLVLNCGSATLKFQVLETDADKMREDADRRLASGLVERIGGQALIKFTATGQPTLKQARPVRDHRAAIDEVLRWVVSEESRVDSVRSLADIHAVGHRVVHGGERFQKSALIDAEVLDGIEDCIDLAPLHNPTNLKGIYAATELLGSGVAQVAVFDTAFHSTMPDTAYLYAIPYQLYRRYRIRRYGFHGTSHRYISYRYRKMHHLESEQVRIISLHLGNGCSACAIAGGASVDTSMGFTPVEGLVMGTRSGDLDPAILPYLAETEGMSLNEIETMLNKRSGLLGISGLTGDMRDLLAEETENQDRRVHLAIEMFSLRVKKYIGAYLAVLGGADAVVFTGGIGENAPLVRERVCRGMEWAGLKLDPDRNAAHAGGSAGLISTDDSRLRALVIPTDEELLIARDTVRCVQHLERRW
ncbi:MAG: acetate kinase [Candidatus Eremiobacterota bacterium]